MIAFSALLLLSISCTYHHTTLTQNQAEAQLKKVFQASLYKGIHNDSARVRYYVQSVIYYEDPNNYNCEFKVRMVQPNLDTTGIMRAIISKDFTSVKRDQ